MGRRLLLSALALLALHVAACGREEPGHAQLPCAGCHVGAPTLRVDGATGRPVPASSDDACTGCHEGLSGDVGFGSVELPHRGHGADSALAAGCAACHTHDGGDSQLRVTTNACLLCHATRFDGSTPAECRTCHVDPQHTAFASQGVPLLHASLPWIGGECIRCHFDVGQPDTDVGSAACVDCHRDADRVVEAGAGVDLHPAHTGVVCASCHVDAEHHVGAMSSSVALDCAQCHTVAHELTSPEPLLADAASCNACHAGAHRAQQAMVLGVAPGAVPAMPADKFLAGLTCRSCHAGGVTGAAPGASDVTCTSCHPAPYARVLRWWQQGSEERIAEARRFAAAAGAAAARSGDERARTHAAQADSLVRFVGAGGAAHNLPLSYDALVAAVAHADSALRGAGTTLTLPQLGRRPRMGQCTYCHYQWREPRFESEMPDAFHREVMERGRAAARRLEARAP